MDLDRLLYGVTVFVSAVLLLLVQPMLTKAILPWFGGSAGVWTSSMLFYQLLLLLGYLYAHVLARRLPVRTQAIIHLGLLAITVLLLPVRPNAGWKPTATEDPLPRILGLLTTTVGLPYFVLSTTSPLLQSWFAQRTTLVLPYRLFAISNLGSLVALLVYPAAMEPLLSTQWQMTAWSSGYVIFAVLCGIVAWQGLHVRTTEQVGRSERGTIGTWLGLAVCPSILWLAVANHLSQDVAPVPFLWILPLGLYLLSFVLTFDHERWYRPGFYKWALPVSWIAVFIRRKRGRVHQHQILGSYFRVGAVPVLHVLPWRTGAAQAAHRRTHDVLPDDCSRRRLGRRVCRCRGAASVQRVPRTAAGCFGNCIAVAMAAISVSG